MTAPVAFVRQKKGHSPPFFPSFFILFLICLLSENAEILYTSAFHASKIRVTTESQRSQNGVRTESEQSQNVSRSLLRTIFTWIHHATGVA